jgi:PilZ domain
MFTGTAFPHHERRAVQRIAVDYPALLRTPARQWLVRIIDISSMGAKLAMDAPPKAGAQAFIRCETHELFCKVVWSSETSCSVSFDRTASQELLTLVGGTAGVVNQIVANPDRIAPGRKRRALQMG